MKNAAAQNKFEKVMHEFGQGELKSHGKQVTDHKQALAIAFSEARNIDPNYAEGGDIGKIAVKKIVLTDSDGKPFIGTSTFKSANEALKKVWENNKHSDAKYKIEWQDGETLSGSIDLEPHDFHSSHKDNILSWHLKTFWGNVSKSDVKPYLSQEEINEAKNLVEKYAFDDEKGPVTSSGLVAIKSVIIEWAEGKIAYSNSYPKEFPDFLAAHKYIQKHIELTDLGYDKHKVLAAWVDGEDWNERIDISTKENNPNQYDNIFGAYIARVGLFYIGIVAKQGFTSEYEERANAYLAFIKKYDFQITRDDWNKVVSEKAIDFSSSGFIPKRFKIDPFTEAEFKNLVEEKFGNFIENLSTSGVSKTKKSTTGKRGSELQKIYEKGTAGQLWDAWTEKERTHFLIDHASQFNDLMGDDYSKSAKAYTTLTYDTLPSEIKKEVAIHHAMGMYNDGGGAGEIDYSFDYQMLSRLQMDNDYYLGHGNRSEKQLWAGNVDDQIAEMKRIWNKLPVKPEWLSMEDILNYEKQMKEQSPNMNNGGSAEITDRMYNFLKDDLKELEKAVSEGNKEEVERFFSYWNQHLKSLKTKTNDRVYNFLKDDFEKLEKAVSEGDKEEIEKFFSYWNYHLKSLKMADGGAVEAYIDYLNKKKGFKQDRKTFKGKNAIQDAEKWGRKNLENYHPDMIHINFLADGGPIKNNPLQVLRDELDDIAIDLEGEEEEALSNLRINLDEVNNAEEAAEFINDFESGGLKGISDSNEKQSIIESINKFRNSSKKDVPGGRGFFGLEKGEKIKSEDEISKGDILLEHSDQFNADNTVKVTEIRKYGTNVHVSGIYWDPIKNQRIGNEEFAIDPDPVFQRQYYRIKSIKMNEPKISPAKKRLQERINTLKAAKANAGASAQQSIQAKIDVLQRQFDYSPSAKERAQANKGKFALDVPASYSKGIYKKLWAMNVLPSIHKLNDTHSIVVSSQINLDKAYKVYSEMLKENKEKVPALSKISRKL